MKPEREPYIRIIVGILAVAAIPPLAVILFDGNESLALLEKWQSGLGAFFGAFFGLGAILIGALFNADLNRRRDDRQRDEEARLVATALTSEFSAIVRQLDLYYHQIALLKNQQFDDEKSRISYLEAERARWAYRPHFRVAEKVFEKIGILGSYHTDVAISTVFDIEHFFALFESTSTPHFFSDKTLSVIKNTGELTLNAAHEIANRIGEDFSLPSSFPIPRPQSLDEQPLHTDAPD